MAFWACFTIRCCITAKNVRTTISSMYRFSEAISKYMGFLSAAWSGHMFDFTKTISIRYFQTQMKACRKDLLMTKLSGAMETAIKHSLDIQTMKYSSFMGSAGVFLPSSTPKLPYSMTAVVKAPLNESFYLSQDSSTSVGSRDSGHSSSISEGSTGSSRCIRAAWEGGHRWWWATPLTSL